MKSKLKRAFKALFILLFVSGGLVFLSLIMAHALPSLSSRIANLHDGLMIPLRLIKLITYVVVLTGLVFWDTALKVLVRGLNKDERIAEYNKHRFAITAVFAFIMLFDGVLPFLAGSV